MLERMDDMTVTATEFKTNFGKYLDMIVSGAGSITITKNGKKIASVSKPEMTAVEMLSSLMDKEISTDYDMVKASALGEKYEIDL